jgi:hypothetical protein
LDFILGILVFCKKLGARLRRGWRRDEWGRDRKRRLWRMHVHINHTHATCGLFTRGFLVLLLARVITRRDRTVDNCRMHGVMHERDLVSGWTVCARPSLDGAEQVLKND